MSILKIIKCTADELIIEPIINPDKHKHAESSDLYREFADLKKYLATQGLVENEDYEHVKVSPSSYQIRFGGQSLVLRAIHTIPVEQIEFAYSMHDVVSKKEQYVRNRLGYATLIQPKNCLVYDQQFVEKAFQEIFNYLKDKINKIHSKHIGKPSSIITQLNSDLRTIESMEHEDFFVNPKYLLLVGSLMLASENERVKKTIVASYHLFKGDSILAPEYKQLVSTVRTRYAPALAQYPKLQLMELYNKYVLTPQACSVDAPPVPAIAASSSGHRQI